MKWFWSGSVFMIMQILGIVKKEKKKICYLSTISMLILGWQNSLIFRYFPGLWSLCTNLLMTFLLILLLNTFLNDWVRTTSVTTSVTRRPHLQGLQDSFHRTTEQDAKSPDFLWLTNTFKFLLLHTTTCYLLSNIQWNII